MKATFAIVVAGIYAFSMLAVFVGLMLFLRKVLQPDSAELMWGIYGTIAMTCFLAIFILAFCADKIASTIEKLIG